MNLVESELVPDSVLPAQLGDAHAGGARIQPEKRLQVAVLADAVLTFHRWAEDQRPRGRRRFADVEAWFASEDADGPFAFVSICQSLHFDPGYVRKGLRQWRTRLEARAQEKRPLRRESSGTRHQVQLPRLRRVA
jgi:hypothetical protein